MMDLPSPATKRALLISSYQGGAKKTACLQSLDELERLVEIIDVVAVHKEPVAMRKFDASTYVGKGKLTELLTLAQECDLLVVDDEITPAQQRNLEKIFGFAVIDRTEVILEVFSRAAKTKEAKVQVELAKVRYELPRLKRLWTHLSRQRGGGVSLRGEGEKQIEIDRRLLKRRVERLQMELKQIVEHRKTQRASRKRSGITTFAIVGYTNAGKSTLLNAMTKAGVLVEDKLFATLDTTTRKYKLPNGQEILLIDTVGFIRKLPHTLVAAFRSTLEEATSADILLHLIDVSDSAAEDQAEATIAVLKELGAAKKPILTLLNKIDAMKDRRMLHLMRFKYPKTVAISALTGEGLNDLVQMMMQELGKNRTKVILRLPQSQYGKIHEIEQFGFIEKREYIDNDVILHVETTPDVINRFAHFQIDLAENQ